MFWLDKSSGLWRAGRVDGPSISAEALGEPEIAIRSGSRITTTSTFPGIRTIRPLVASDQRSRRVVGNSDSDTPFFADGRTAIVQIFRQRAGYKGLTALASSAIELIHHQVVIIRRVLADPVQRYILADEVGLGRR